MIGENEGEGVKEFRIGEPVAKPALIIKVSKPDILDDDSEESLAYEVVLVDPDGHMLKKADPWMLESAATAIIAANRVRKVIETTILTQEIDKGQKLRKAMRQTKAQPVPATAFPLRMPPSSEEKKN